VERASPEVLSVLCVYTLKRIGGGGAAVRTWGVGTGGVRVSEKTLALGSSMNRGSPSSTLTASLLGVMVKVREGGE
jgi:hypothetical protein